MAKKKWFGLAAVVAAVGAGAAYAVKKIKAAPDQASGLIDSAAEAAKTGSGKVAAAVGTAKDKAMRKDSEPDGVEEPGDPDVEDGADEDADTDEGPESS